MERTAATLISLKVSINFLKKLKGFRGSPHFDDCERFCKEYDQPSFDPGFQAEELSVFLPVVKRVFGRRPFWNAPGEPKSHCVIQN
jgi:predicted HD phosphohydrolase